MQSFGNLHYTCLVVGLERLVQKMICFGGGGGWRPSVPILPLDSSNYLISLTMKIGGIGNIMATFLLWKDGAKSCVHSMHLLSDAFSGVIRIL
jgi:hypothetical protein